MSRRSSEEEIHAFKDSLKDLSPHPMEAFSDQFRNRVKQLFESEVTSKPYRILATLPSRRMRSDSVDSADEGLRQSAQNTAIQGIHRNRSNSEGTTDRVVNMLCDSALR